MSPQTQTAKTAKEHTVNWITRSSQIVECLDNTRHITINRLDGFIVIKDADIQITGCREIREMCEHNNISRILPDLLELNTKQMTLDLRFRSTREKGHIMVLRSLTWGEITHEFLDALFCANQRIRNF